MQQNPNNARYYQDQNDSLINENLQRNTLTTQTNPTMVSSNSATNNIRPITRDVKLRSQAANRNPGAGLNNQKVDNYNSQNNGMNGKQGSAISDTDGTKTFQNTINIGSFINEINNQQQKEVSKTFQNIKTFSNTIENNTDGSSSL